MRINSPMRIPCVRLGLLAAALAGAAPAAGQESAWLDNHQRRERLEKMTAAEKEQLLRQKERFEQLSPEERQQLRDTCQTLAKAPDGRRLFGVLERYCQWLKTLTPVERAEVLALPPEARVAKIRTLMQEQEEQRLRSLANLSYQEAKAVREWFGEVVKPHEEKLWSLLQPDAQRDIESKADDPDVRRRMMVWWLFHQDQGDTLRALIPQDVDPLLAHLTEERRQEFNKLRDPAQRRQLLERWLTGAVVFGRGFGRGSFRVSEKDLQEFFVNELSREEQTRLEMMPRDAMQRELRGLYFAHRYGRGREGGPPRGPEFPRRKRGDDEDRRENRGPQENFPSRRDEPR
jgi:hypothetical protein